MMSWEYEDRDFYSIKLDPDTGTKLIHIYGYIYYSGDGSCIPYRDLEYTDFILPLEEFLSDSFDYDTYQNGIKQDVGYLTRELAEKYLKRYWHYHIIPNNDERPKPMPYSKLSMDTPCGEYVDIRIKKTQEEKSDEANKKET